MSDTVKKVPQVMQMEALECGAACLDMILAYYGRWVPLEVVRADCGVSRDGSKATNVLKAARSYGLEAKGMSYSTKSLRERGSFPCILFWNFNHFVVLRGFRGKYAYINDPARGQIKVPLDEFEKSFTGVTLVFKKTEAFEPGGEPPSAYKAALSRLKGLELPIVFVMLTATISSVLGIFNTSLNRVFLDRVLSGDNPEWLVPLTGIMLLVAILLGIVSVLNDYNVTINTFDDKKIFSNSKVNDYTYIEQEVTHAEMIVCADFVAEVKFPFNKLLLAGEPLELDACQELLRKRYDGLLDIYKSAPYFLEIMPFGVSKGSMLPVLLDKLGISREELIAFGDNYNDMTMIGYAGMGVAMGNAEPEVKKIANYVCETNDEDGVAKTIEQMILSKA